MPNDFAFVTLLTSDRYLPGCLTAIHSLLDCEGGQTANDFDTVCLVTPATLSVESIKSVRSVFSLVVGVEAIESNSHKELNLLGRPDLVATLTKLHLFRLTQYKRVIYLDADTLVFRPLSHLFTSIPRDVPLAAAPDIGWPDCFNSGVMVCTPSTATFEGIKAMGDSKGSWDGGDQGLLNDYFDNWHRLSFTYNVTPSSFYQYEPAMLRYGSSISVVHFIGMSKPWDRLNRSRPSSSAPTAESANDYNGLLHRWFDVYERHYGQLSTAAVASTSQSPFASGAGAFVVPSFTSAWDAPPSKQQIGYRPPTPEQLKTMFHGRMNTAQNAFGVYTSLPFPGREDLLGNIPEPPQPTQQPEAQPAAEQPAQPEPGPSSPPHHEPAMSTWNPAISAPTGNELQMREPIDDHYENVWDDPTNKANRQFFAPPTYAKIPTSIQSHYESVIKSAPRDRGNVRPVFPWEQTGGQRATRVFPDEPDYDQRSPAGSVPPATTVVPAELPTLPPVPAPTAEVAPPPISDRGLPADLNYANAWDNISSIKRYADGLIKPKKEGAWKASKATDPISPNRNDRVEGRSSQPDEVADVRARGTAQGARRREASTDRDDGEQGDDEDEEDEEDAEELLNRPPIRFRNSYTNNQSRSSSRGSTTPPASASLQGGMVAAATGPVQTSSSRGGAAIRPYMRRGDGSVGSSSRLPTLGSLLAPAELSGETDANDSSNLTISAMKQALAPTFKKKVLNLPPASMAGPSSASTRRRSSIVPAVPSPLGSPTVERNGYFNDSSSSSGAPASAPPQQPMRAERVFDPKTDTGVIRKEGLAALQRFVTSMEKSPSPNSRQAALPPV